jgi:8-oxo-dGTP pyrophosphatase MutT (NUDIX family)
VTGGAIRAAIRARVVCVFRRDDRILVSMAVDPRDGRRYARTIGGGIETGERSVDALRREIREELGLEITGPQLLGVLENIFALDDRQVHEIVFVYDAEFAEASAYERAGLPVNEAACVEPARWVPMDTFRDGATPIYPRDLLRLLGDPTVAASDA